MTFESPSALHFKNLPQDIAAMSLFLCNDNKWNYRVTKADLLTGMLTFRKWLHFFLNFYQTFLILLLSISLALWMSKIHCTFSQNWQHLLIDDAQSTTVKTTKAAACLLCTRSCGHTHKQFLLTAGSQLAVVRLVVSTSAKTHLSKVLSETLNPAHSLSINWATVVRNYCKTFFACIKFSRISRVG